jgi:RimJ/RimL family protein N-acetyltransferase
VSPFLRGERCSLRPLRREDVDGGWADWFNDPEVTRHMYRGVFPNTREEQLAFYESIAAGDQSNLVLAIAAEPGGEHVGTIGLHRIDWVNRSAEYGIVVGEESARGRGIGTEATRLICRHGFERLNLHRIWLGVLASHESAIRMYQGLGFQEEGRLREELLRDGRREDKLIMGLLAGELRDAGG